MLVVCCNDNSVVHTHTDTHSHQVPLPMKTPTFLLIRLRVRGENGWGWGWDAWRGGWRRKRDLFFPLGGWVGCVVVSKTQWGRLVSLNVITKTLSSLQLSVTGQDMHFFNVQSARRDTTEDN